MRLKEIEEKKDLSGATSHDAFVNKPSEEVRQKAHFIETPVDLRQLVEASEERNFSGFREEKGNMRRIISVDKKIRCMREQISGIWKSRTNLLWKTKN